MAENIPKSREAALKRLRELTKKSAQEMSPASDHAAKEETRDTAPAPSATAKRRAAKRQDLKDAIARATAATNADTPWFSRTKETSIQADTPIETFAREATQRLVRSMVDAVVSDHRESGEFRAKAAEILSSGLSDPTLRKELEDTVRSVESLSADLSNLSAEQVRSYANAVTAAVEAGTPIGDLVADNPVARLVLDAVETGSSASVAMLGRSGKEMTLPDVNVNTRSARALTIFGLSLATTVMSIGVTKTGTVQGIDTLMSKGWNVARIPVDTLAHVFELTLQMNAVEAKQAAVFALSLSASSAASGVIIAKKSIGKQLGPVMRITALVAAVYSAGFGLIGLNNLIGQSGQIQTIGTNIKRVGEPLRTTAAEVKKTMDDVFAGMNSLIDSAVAKEASNRAYAQRSALIASALSGSHDENRRIAEKSKMSNPDASEMAHIEFQRRLLELKKEFGLSENQGLVHLVDRYRTKVDYETAPQVLESVIRLGTDAANRTFWGQIGLALNPVADTLTPEGMHRAALGARDEFKKLFDAYAATSKEGREQIRKYLDGVRKIGGERNNDITQLIMSLEKAFRDLPPNMGTQISSQFESLGPASGTFMWFPDWPEKRGDWERIQSSLEKTWLKDAGVNVAQSTWWASIYLIALGGLFYGFDHWTEPASRRLNRRRQEDFDDEFPEAYQGLNDAESAVADQIALSIVAATQRISQLVDRPNLLRSIPHSLISLHVRRELREQFLEEYGAAVKSDMGRFVHGVVLGATPEYVRLFQDYREWLSEKIDRLAQEPWEVVESLTKQMYPSISNVQSDLRLLENASDAKTRTEILRALGRSSETLRTEQLRSIAQSIQERLGILGATTEGLERRSDETQTFERVEFDGTREMVISREVAMSAFALSQVRGEQIALTETLAWLKERGITPELPANDTSATLTIGAFPIGSRAAVADELAKIEIARTAGIERIDGTYEDFKRFDEYMQTVNVALSDISRDTLAKESRLSQYAARITFAYAYVPQIGAYSVVAEVKEEGYGKVLGSVWFNDPVPDFESKPDQQVDALKVWLAEDSDAVRGLVAQASFARNTDTLAELSRDIGTQQLNLKQIKDNQELLVRIQKSLDLAALVRSQEPLMDDARHSRHIEETKFDLFVEPKEKFSDSLQRADVAAIIADIESSVLPDGVSVTYSPLERMLIIAHKNTKNSESLALTNYSRPELQQRAELVSPRKTI